MHIDNPDYQIDSYQLDYFTETGVSDFSGPTKFIMMKVISMPKRDITIRTKKCLGL